MIPSLTTQSYKDLESVSSLSGKRLFSLRIRSIVDLMTEPTSKPFAMAYNSAASTLLVTRLHLVDDQWNRLALLELSIRHTT